ncbi:hypothetical protein TrST_g5634 [Triparma strigata]|uniref:Uncharacterized protein n=1 Tax=Triparma strigata TaxID=1606541 RepID=A0A9W6ZLS1_9STRA|nr:hypothetical protein TrST_g5634 [Triparma strigata]
MTVTASPPSSPPQSTPQSNANPNNATDPLTTHLTSLITNYNHNFDYTSSLFYAHLLLHHNPSPTNLLLCARTEILAGNYGTALSLCTGVPGGENMEDYCNVQLKNHKADLHTSLWKGVVASRLGSGGASDFAKVASKDGWCWTAISGLSRLRVSGSPPPGNSVPDSKINDLINGIKYRPSPTYSSASTSGNVNGMNEDGGTPYSSSSPFQVNFGTPNLTPIQPPKIRTQGKTMSRINFRDTGRSGFSEESSVRGGRLSFGMGDDGGMLGDLSKVSGLHDDNDSVKTPKFQSTLNLPSATPPPLPPHPNASSHLPPSGKAKSASTPDPTPLNSFAHLTPSDGTSALASLMRTYTFALNAYHKYDLHAALKLYASLPPHLLNSSYVQKQIGKCHFELSNYAAAKLHLEAGHALCPTDVTGLEYLSTVYWHLKQDVELSYLARRVSTSNPTSPESWICVGNCFSLQKEHDLALKFFQRSLSLSPSFTYAHTLSGHEYVSNEDFQSAITCFRSALTTNPSHYNAWYGLGAIYYRQEKFNLAASHFERAIDVNPTSSILYCHLGMVRQAEKRYFEALEVLNKAFELEPSNPQARYQMSTVLISLERYPEALESLYLVLDSAPREASVHFLIGKVHKKLGDSYKAMVHFVRALDLDPKDNNLIKQQIDRLDEVDGEEDASGF